VEVFQEEASEVAEVEVGDNYVLESIMNESRTKVIKDCLAKSDIHEKWEMAYRTETNEKFYEQAFDYIVHFLNAPKNYTFLDAVCGTCAHSVRLANRGYLVQAVDFSENILKKAEKNVKMRGLQKKIKIQNEDMLSFLFKDNSFDYILCWGVLMHIPDIERAVSENTRILRPGGVHCYQ
jgi:ubiquinone/menaquinone biosynthesis C-methylase UbiE